MDWSLSYSASYYVAVVDPFTWRDNGRFEITSGSIKRTPTDLRQSADVSSINYTTTDEEWIRIWMIARQGDEVEREAVFTGITSTPDLEIDGQKTTYSMQCYSVLKPAQDVLLPRGYYIPIDTDCKVIIKRLLSVTMAPVEIAYEEEILLQSAIIAEDGENNLSMVDKILDSLNWRLTIDGDGTINVGPQAEIPVYTFDSLVNDVIEPSLTVSYDWYSCPNVFRAISDTLSAEARDEDDSSPFSIQNRRREIWAEDTSVTLNEDESISEYALRRLQELQSVSTSISYTRSFNPSINVTDLIILNYPAHEIQGIYYITSQTIEVGYNAATSEEVVFIE